jgi:hypothetical protein
MAAHTPATRPALGGAEATWERSEAWGAWGSLEGAERTPLGTLSLERTPFRTLSLHHPHELLAIRMRRAAAAALVLAALAALLLVVQVSFCACGAGMPGSAGRACSGGRAVDVQCYLSNPPKHSAEWRRTLKA